MATRALIRVFKEDGQPLVCIYKHFDGYPRWLGKLICEAFNYGDCVVASGHGLNDEIPKRFNTMEDAAAWLVAFLKTYKSRDQLVGDAYMVSMKELIGDVYIVPFPKNLDEDDLYGAEFLYDIWCKYGHIGITLYTLWDTRKEIYRGPLTKFDPDALHQQAYLAE